jgi:hypothetical protein
MRRGSAMYGLLLAVLLCYQSRLFAAPASLEYEVKAAFLLKFTKFVDWPATAFATAGTPLTICILGDDPFGRTLDQIVEGESVNGHRVAVERIRPDQTKSCHVVYTGDTKPVAALTDGSPGVLTVGEGDSFIQQGGIIGFIVDNRRVRFDINFKAANKAGVKLSSKLLSVARTVEK